MAFETAKDRAIPEVTVTAQYEVQRMNDPYVRVIFNEAVRTFEDSVAVSAGPQADELVVAAWAGRTDLVGKEVQTPKGETLGMVDSWNNTTTTVTLSAPVVTVPAEVQIEKYNGFGSVVHKLAPTGRWWAIRIPSTDPVAMQYLQTMLATAHLQAVRAVLDQLGNTTITDLDILGAITALGQQGENLDSYLNEVSQKVEQDRRAGQLPFGIIEGKAPYTT